MAKYLKKTQAALLALEGKGLTSIMVRLLQACASHLYEGVSDSVSIFQLAEATYSLTLDDRLVKKVMESVQEKISKQKQQAVFNFKHDLIHAECTQSHIDELSNAFESDLELIVVK
jgi:hypothetical protein